MQDEENAKKLDALQKSRPQPLTGNFIPDQN
jgi:hypothetical protein